jgi:sugar/nucleoside kinase (ribokinase family)
MNFLVIGHSVVDKIIEREHRSIKPGGIFYTVISLLSQIESDDKIFLCSNIDEKNTILFEDVYDQVEREFLNIVNSIPNVELVLSESGERKEAYSEVAENLSLPTDNLNRFNGILINMISGYDISLRQLQQLRINYNRLIYFDVHTLSRGVDKQLNRIFRQIKDFSKWAKCIDVLQANESELKTLSNKSEEITIVEELFSYGIKQIVITRSEKGATVFCKENDSIKSSHVNALRVNTINKVGCGDVFGAVYFYNCIKNNKIQLALEQANLYAGISTTYIGAKDFLNLKNDANERIS